MGSQVNIFRTHSSRVIFAKLEIHESRVRLGPLAWTDKSYGHYLNGYQRALSLSLVQRCVEDAGVTCESNETHRNNRTRLSLHVDNTGVAVEAERLFVSRLGQSDFQNSNSSPRYCLCNGDTPDQWQTSVGERC